MLSLGIKNCLNQEWQQSSLNLMTQNSGEFLCLDVLPTLMEYKAGSGIKELDFFYVSLKWQDNVIGKAGIWPCWAPQLLCDFVQIT